MTAYVARRLALILPTVFGVVTLVFFVMRVVPGDVAVTIGGTAATEAEVEHIRQQLNLDDPVYVQYWSYLKGVSRGDLDRSVYTHLPVTEELKRTIPNTLKLALLSATFGVLVGISMGVVAAARQRSVWDYGAMGFAGASLALPNFVLALVLIFVFAERLGWLPATGAPDLKHLILPVLALGARESAVILRMTRATMLDVLHSDFIRTARAKGASETRVLLHHALRNALLPIVTVVGLQLGFSLGGSVVIETVFGYPGVGRLIVQAVNQRDYTIVQGGVLVLSLAFIFINLVVDLSYAWLDPRVKYAS